MDTTAEILGPLGATPAPAELPLFPDASCGFPSPAEAWSEPPLSLDDLVRVREPSTFLVRARGDSMIEAGVYPDDVLVVDRSRQARSGDVIVARVGAEFLVKTLVIDGERVSLVPANRHHRPIVLGDGEELEVWGVATWNLHRLGSSP
ncbi:MAG: translesion error-prone DNA polymerase V autoproteolytic subunit [Halomonadaceae bacterium]|nr:translesion error-prone DNA polymerase V autoproteolytic subunit [Halomonadaceae bacterium]